MSRSIVHDTDVVSSALPITIKSLTKRYGSLYALNAVDIDIRNGEFLTLLGPSGSGKTTLLMAIAGFNRPDSGSIKFGDQEVVLMPPHKRNVGMVFQNYALFPHMTVAENIAFPLKLRGVKQRELSDRVQNALRTVQLDGLGERTIDALSGGQRQRVALARAFVFRPRILLMDEPLSALDKKLREQMQIELKHLHEQLGVTTVYVTHDQREALTMSDRIAVINHGCLEQVDTPQRIYNQPSSAFVADFVGESTILPVQRRDQYVLFEEQVLRYDFDNQGEWSLVIRPERLCVVEGNNVNNDRSIYFNGIVKDFVYQGETAFAVMSTAQDHDIAFRFGTDGQVNTSAVTKGQAVTLCLHRSDIILVPRAPTSI